MGCAQPRSFVSLATTLSRAGSVLDWIFPPQCPGCDCYPADDFCSTCMSHMPVIRSPLCPRCGLAFPSSVGDDHLCGRCALGGLSLEQARACTTYDAEQAEPGPLERALRRFKYGRDLSLRRVLAALLTARCPFDATSFDVAVPVPLHLSRLRRRGFNQSQLLAGGLSERFGLAVDPFALERIRATAPQVGMKAAERRRNVHDAFRARADRAAGKRVLLVDDVYTSGATLEESAKALRRAGAISVHALVLARAVQP